MRILWSCVAALLLVGVALFFLRPSGGPHPYVAVVARGNAMLEKGDAAGAAREYEKAAREAPESADIQLNLAIAYLRLGRNQEAIAASRATLALDRNNPAALYIMGCARMHLLEWDAAARAFDQCIAINPRIAAVNFQLGLAHEQLGNLEAAQHDFQGVVYYDPSHAAGHFRLQRLYQKLGRAPEAAIEMKLLQALLAKNGNAQPDAAALESCVYTRPRSPFILDEPAKPGIPVAYTDATADAFGAGASKYKGPIAVIDYAHDGRNSLFVGEAAGGFRLLDNQKGRFEPLGRPIPAPGGAPYSQALVGDLDDDGTDDVVVLGEAGSRVYRMRPDGKAADFTASAGLGDLRAKSGLLADIDFTGNLDIVSVRAGGGGVEVRRNLGDFAFADATEELGLSAPLGGSISIGEEDWGNDGLPALFVCRSDAAPSFFALHRATGFTKGSVSDGWPKATLFASGDLNNDLEADAVLVAGDEIDVRLSGRANPMGIPLRGFRPKGLLLLDFDNDGWLDILAYGDGGIRAWRNLGHAGFEDVSEATGLSRVGAVSSLVSADFEGKGARDLVGVTPSGLLFLRNEGASANHLLRLRLKGTRSNASSLGVRLELTAGGWRTSRTVHALPVEIGTGSHAKVDSVAVHWTDLTTTNPAVEANPGVFTIVEPKLPTGSCPYLYAWDGSSFRFVSDVLGAAPLGLPATPAHLVPANPREMIALGTEAGFPARAGSYEVRLTDELREILYLHGARLVAADHPVGTFVCPTSKLLEGPPFPEPELWTLRPLRAPVRAVRSDGLDVTEILARADGKMAGPVELRRPQERGFARPYSITMDFGEIDVRRPLVLVLTGWLQFGGGMANISVSFDRGAGPPFPRLEAQVGDGSWVPVRTDVGAPCGKTKTILVDLEGRLPVGSRRLRVTTAFEIYWDAALLCERLPDAGSLRTVEPSRADLHWRGFSRYEPEKAGLPLTPDYRRVMGTPPWDFTPAGWCTRYGDVRPLLGSRDDRLAVLNGGDELALSFPAAGLPPAGPGQVRDFFLNLTGWDKDADFHVRRGDEVGPLPSRAMDDQRYGAGPGEGRDGAWTAEYETRWVGPAVLPRQPAPLQ